MASVNDKIAGLQSNFVGSTTWAAKPIASSHPNGTLIFVSDVGPSGTYFEASGSRWVPVNGRIVLSNMTMPCVKAPTFTGTTNGSITLGTAVPLRFPKCYMYFPSNSLVASHAAGWYYVEMSSTTAAIVYNNTYTPAAGTFPTEPSNKVEFSGAVPGGTGVTSEVTFFETAIPAGLLGETGSLISDMLMEMNNSAGTKSQSIKWNGTAVLSGSNLTSAAALHAVHRSTNRAFNAQRSAGIVPNILTSTNPVSTSIDTSSSVTVSYTVTASGAATDLVGCSSLICELVVAA